MAEINTLVCNDGKSNTGYGSCVLDISKMVMSIEVPDDFIIDAVMAQTLQAQLKLAIQAATKSARIFPFAPFAAITDNSADPTLQTLGYGSQVVVREGNYNWVFQTIRGGFCAHKKARTFNKNYRRFLFADDQNIIYGTTGTKPTGEVGIRGYVMDNFYARPWKANDGTNVTQYLTMYDFPPAQANEYMAYVQADFDVTSLMGLENGLIEVVSGPTTGAVVVKIVTGCSKENLGDEYGADLADPTLWLASNDATGAAVPVDTVTYNATAKTYEVTLDVADASYTAITATGKVRLGLVDPAALAVAEVYGVESVPVTYVRGA